MGTWAFVLGIWAPDGGVVGTLPLDNGVQEGPFLHFDIVSSIKSSDSSYSTCKHTFSITHYGSKSHFLIMLSGNFSPSSPCSGYSRLHCSLLSCLTVQHISQVAKLFYFLQHASIYYQSGTLVVSIAIAITILPLSRSSWTYKVLISQT